MSESVAGIALRAAARLKPRMSAEPPVLALILGSGLGGLAELVENPTRVPFAEIEGFPPAKVEGHAGALVAGTLEGKPVLVLAGRFHMYEGHDARRAALPVRLAHALGARALFVSNAAGGVNRSFRPGDLMIIRDHINLMWRNPLEGPLEPGDVRFPDMSAPYDAHLSDQLRAAAARSSVRAVEGVYAGLLGPSYETPAETRMLERIGADAVGMSTVPEVIVARALGMRVVGMSCITNAAPGIAPGPVSHEEVLDTTRRVAQSFQQVVLELVRCIA